MIKTFNLEEIEEQKDIIKEIIMSYEVGHMTIDQIAAAYQEERTTIYRILKSNNVKMRGRRK